MNRVARAVLLLVFIISAGTSIAFDRLDPNNARGFKGNVFQSGDVDNINVFNGNLIVRLPIGQAYTTGPSLSYQLVLTANSKVWDFAWDYTLAAGHQRQAIPERESNAGLGWALSLGRLIEPRAGTTVTPRTNWTFLGSDGSQHEFHPTLRAADPLPPAANKVFFTNDGSYLRLTLDAASDTEGSFHHVETPDGTVYEFHQPTDVDRKTRLRFIRDRFNNWVEIDYTYSPCIVGEAPECEDEWVITDGHGSSTSSRSHVVAFKNKGDRYNQHNFQRVVDTVTLAAYDEQTATYTFHYADDAEEAPPTTVPRAGCGDPDPRDSVDVNVPFLQSITLPDGSSYAMTNLSGGDCSSGALATLTLPTRGQIRWGYGAYELPLPDCTSDSSWAEVYGGVTQRSFFQPGASQAEAVWTYAPVLTPVAPGIISANCNHGKPTQVPPPLPRVQEHDHRSGRQQDRALLFGVPGRDLSGGPWPVPAD